ncbi:uncharacterized protein LOC119689687 [Teleopsis dalmanni]|uniref:uncharacterized protein LOC119689687 n=1 Tax=Teleopsis dalmanni TaxID=139649 RepID=UPI0018CF6D15|nr:uncharacterized protein LOC119689687 [Teleopsis dalmanni]
MHTSTNSKVTGTEYDDILMKMSNLTLGAAQNKVDPICAPHDMNVFPQEQMMSEFAFQSQYKYPNAPAFQLQSIPSISSGAIGVDMDDQPSTSAAAAIKRLQSAKRIEPIEPTVMGVREFLKYIDSSFSTDDEDDEIDGNRRAAAFHNAFKASLDEERKSAIMTCFGNLSSNSSTSTNSCSFNPRWMTCEEVSTSATPDSADSNTSIYQSVNSPVRATYMCIRNAEKHIVNSICQTQSVPNIYPLNNVDLSETEFSHLERQFINDDYVRENNGAIDEESADGGNS